MAAYEYKAGGDLSDDLALLRALGLNESSVVVDLGAGAFALAAARLCQQVVAVATIAGAGRRVLWEGAVPTADVFVLNGVLTRVPYSTSLDARPAGRQRRAQDAATGRRAQPCP